LTIRTKIKLLLSKCQKSLASKGRFKDYAGDENCRKSFDRIRLTTILSDALLFIIN